MSDPIYPCSPNEETGGLVYFPRMCEKIRLMAESRLHPDLHDNLGKGMDLWTCEFLEVDYQDFAKRVLEDKLDNEAALNWARENGKHHTDLVAGWWNCWMKTVGFRDKLAEVLERRIAESGLTDRTDLITMFDYIDADEGRR